MDRPDVVALFRRDTKDTDVWAPTLEIVLSVGADIP